MFVRLIKDMRIAILSAVLCVSFFITPSVHAQVAYRVHSFGWERVEVTPELDATPSAEAAALLKPYKAGVDSIMAPVLGMSRVAMSPKRPVDADGLRARAVLHTGLVADYCAQNGILWYVRGLRNNMPEGIVRRGDIMLISPFENYLVVLEMKGSDLLELMRNIAAVKGEAVSSSVRMEITADGQLLSCTIGGKEIDPERTYTVATIDYLAEGNDKMYALKKAVKRHDIGLLARDAMMEYVIKHRIIDSKMEGRIVVK